MDEEVLSPVPVPLPVLVVGGRLQVGQRDDVAAVGAQPLLVEAALSILQLLVLAADADVDVVALRAHPGDGGVVALQELAVHPLVVLRGTDTLAQSERAGGEAPPLKPPRGTDAIDVPCVGGAV